MGSLIRFELRKILKNRAGMVACALALVMLMGITVLDVFTTETYDQSGKTCVGLEALDAYRARQESHAGKLDAARVAADLAIYDKASELAKGGEPFWMCTVLSFGTIPMRCFRTRIFGGSTR